ncbi:MAG: WG repeat-containing protein, partial [Flavobacteriales bacterium]|nr:WG repeat-containing protein [Flavobacteriales bacterium]
YKNKIVIPEMYSAFDWLGENFLRVRLDYLYGVYSTETQQIILNADFDFLFRNGEFFVLGKEMLQGLSDLNGEILLQPEYEDIDVQPYGFRSGIARVIKSGKAGFFDLSNKKWITEPVLDIISNYPEANGFFRVNSGGKPVTDNYNQVYEIEGGKWGIVDTNGRQIIPVIYDAIFPFAEDAGIYKCQNPTTTDYYSADGTLLSNGASRFEKSLIGRISSRSPFKPLKISSADGPEGGDATAFYMDDHSGYWLGTGSSGGVYYSADRGYSWEMRNEGLGPVHVYLLIERGDSLYVVYTSGEDRLTDQDAVSVSKVACWNSENKMWLSVYPENEEGKILNILLSMDLLREQRSREQQFPNAWKASSSGEEYFTGFNTMENLYSRSVIDKIEHAGDSIRGIPHDMLFNWGGNVYSDQDKLILLSKSGLYRYGPEHIVDEFSESGLIASDVTDIVASGNDYYLREGDHDIWLWNGIRFKKVFNSFEWNKSKKGKLFSRSTGVLHGDKDKVLVVVADQLLELDKNGTSRILFTGDFVPEVSESFSEYPDHFVQPQEAIRGADGKLRLLCKLVKNNVFEDGIYLLAELNESTGKLNLRSNDIFFTQFTSASLFQDTKNTWLCYDQFLIHPVNRDTLTLPASADVYLFGNRELICSDPSGKIYLLGDSRTLLVYDPVVKKWQKINFEGKNLRCISVDKQGNLYAAEGYQYMFYCDGTGEMYRPAKMYFSQWTNHGFEWVEQENAINTKIICIRPHHNGGLMIGTAGSGLLLGK